MDAEIHAFPPRAERAGPCELYPHRYIVLVGLGVASWGVVLAVGKLIVDLI